MEIETNEKNIQSHYFMMNTLIDSTAVEHSIIATLTNNEKYLIVSKLNILEIYLINHTGLNLIIKKKYATRIELLEKYKPSKDLNDYVVVITASAEIEIIKMTTMSLVIIANGNIKDQFGRNAFFGIKSVVSPDNRILVVNLCEQLLKIIQLPQYPKDKLIASNIKINNSDSKMGKRPE